MTPEWTTAGLTAALTAITAIYAYLTHRLARSAERQIEEISRGALAVKLVFRQGGRLPQLRVENVGRSPITDCTIRLSSQIASVLNSEHINQKPIFSELIQGFPPSCSLEIALPLPHDYIKNIGTEGYPKSFTVSVSYKTGGKTYNELTVIDMSILQGAARLTDQSEEFFYHFPKMMEEKLSLIQKDIRKISEAATKIGPHESSS